MVYYSDLKQRLHRLHVFVDFSGASLAIRKCDLDMPSIEGYSCQHLPNSIKEILDYYISVKR
jgi:hypothetical protein